MISAAFGAAFAGVIVNLTDAGDATAARWLFASFAVLAASALVASIKSGRTPAHRIGITTIRKVFVGGRVRHRV